MASVDIKGAEVEAAEIEAEMETADKIVEVFKSPIPSFSPGELEYERSVATANLLYRFSRPYFVVQPESPAQVQTIIKTAVSNGLKITVKNGGHSFAGFSTTDRGILLDLARMQDVRLHKGPNDKPVAVTLGGGAQWGHAYKALVAGRYDGYMVNGGRCPTVGVSGFVLGGGLGPFTRKFGMGCDSLTEATIVTAKGDLVTVKETDDKQSNEGKLFWALRGAGGGNFGVVVELKMKVQRVHDRIVAGRFTYSQLDEPFMGAMKELYRFDWPVNATIDTHWVCEVKPNDASSYVRFVAYFNGEEREFRGLIDRAIGNVHPELAARMKERTLSEPSTLFLHETLVAQWWEETTRAFPSNKAYSLYTSFVFEKRLEIVNIVADKVKHWLDKFQSSFSEDEAILEVTWVHAGGHASVVGSDQTAFPWRAGTYFTYIMVRWYDKWLSAKMGQFLEAFKSDLRRFSMESEAAYINFADVSLSDYASAYYGPNYPRLQEVKQIWDMYDYFHPPQGVRLPKSKDSAGNDGDWVDLPRRQWESRGAFPARKKADFAGIIRDLTDLGF
ncbi:uncharacterized protein A1O5_00395 [Cladophialophora psammophila CBS 110553]|uniref:FAD-binding PCMH-type domain-containing protein n=1 Tax=Cladophialophora psammophila CBS 110553 TaxID=1182543 RepID=W9X604_9EURO|nr:uncharacterized protein A1O5_00395 [Cladophialophora psammophila CBS 110553]EXJ75887.1 hypothetical protein A1O5_00395 [Cladophialophora psammophila CBS 110553]